MISCLRLPVVAALLAGACAAGQSDAYDEDSFLQSGARLKIIEDAKEAAAAARRKAAAAHEAHQALENLVAEKAAEASYYAAGLCGPSGGCDEETTLLQAGARSVKRRNIKAEEVKEAIAVAKRAFDKAHAAHAASEDVAAEKAAAAAQYVTGMCTSSDDCAEEEETALLQADMRTVKRHEVARSRQDSQASRTVKRPNFEVDAVEKAEAHAVARNNIAHAVARKALAQAEEAFAQALAQAEESSATEDSVAVARKALAQAEEESSATEDSVAEAAEKAPPAAWTGACPRPADFCRHPGSTFVGDRDCDGDCIPDPYCSDDQEQTGFYGSLTSCESTWPTGICKPADPAMCAESTAPSPAACLRPSDFCKHAGAVFDDSKDCDGDGVVDPYCHDEEEQFGFYSSASGCASTWPVGLCETDQVAQESQKQGRILRNLMVVSGAFSVVLVGLTVHSYWGAAGAAAVAA